MTANNRGFDMAVWGGFKEKVLGEPSAADRHKVATARWVQGEEARVTVGENTITVGADDGMNMMEMMLASFAACDAAVVGLHASYLGLKVNDISVEVTGDFNVSSYIGVEDAPGSGYHNVMTTVYLDAPGITQEQIDHLTHMCEVGSPVGDTFARAIPTEIKIVAT
jgi:uncharacterized OsmC-like protein